MTPNLESAIALAAMAHNGQVDKGGAPYILHPLRVMARVSLRGTHEAMAAVLHDVPEDCPFLPVTTLWQMGYPVEVCDALEALTRKKDEDYAAYLERVDKNPIAVLVKLCDLEDNMEWSRLGPQPSEKDFERMARYEAAAVFLTRPQAAR